MTQPDLVSKLREVIERMRSAVEWNMGIARLVVRGWADELESLLGQKGQAARSKWCAKYGGLYDGDYCGMCTCELKPSPSTPIVPSTAGLSAARWTCPDCGYDSMPYPPKDYHICPKCMVEFGNDDRKSTLSEREAKIRKDVLEEAAQHVPMSYRQGFDRFWIECTCGWNKDGVIATGILPNPTLWANHIRALAECPAPAGEVKVTLCPECHADISKGHHSTLRGCWSGEVKGEK